MTVSFFLQPLYDTAYLTLYNISFTSLPILLYSLVEQHVTMETLKREPSLYRWGQMTLSRPLTSFFRTPRIARPLVLCFFSPRDIAKNALLRWPAFLYWTCLGVFDAVIFFFGAYFLFDNTTFTSNGQVSLCVKGGADHRLYLSRCVRSLFQMDFHRSSLIFTGESLVWD